MKPPTDAADEKVDDGYGLEYEGRSPEFIQGAIDILQEMLDFYQRNLEKTIDEWDDEEHGHQSYIRHLEWELEHGDPWVNPSDPEAVAKAREAIERARAQYEKEKKEYEEEKEKCEQNIAIRRNKIAVLEDALWRSLEGISYS
jgi:hypothetical protein